MAKITIEYNGKTVEKEQVCPGLVKSGSAYLVQCSISKKWCYVNQARLDKLVAKHGSQEALGESYVSRDGNKMLKGDTIEETKSTATPATPAKALKMVQEEEEHQVPMTRKEKQSAYDRWVEQNIKYQTERHARIRAQKAAMKEKYRSV